MFVIEIRPVQAWRGLRMVPGSREFTMTPRHARASHWFAKSTADMILRDARFRIGVVVKPLADCPPDRIGIRECTCNPRSFTPPKRRRSVTA